MERDKEIPKLVNVLRRVARAASQAASSRDPEAARFCVRQYNKVLARVSELEPAAATLFTALSEAASADVVRMASQELAAYFEDEAPAGFAAGFGVLRHGCGSRRGWAGRVRVGSCW
ncbi:MAG: hypothetical protein WAV20_11990 [Blastocatellia bacterium]